MPGGVRVVNGFIMVGLVVAGIHPAVIGAVWLAEARPGWFLTAAAARALWVRPSRSTQGDAHEGDLLRGMAAELAAGASLRSALAEGARRAPGLDLRLAVRLATAGRPIGEVSAELERALPHTGRVAGAALEMAAITGGRAAPVFETLALRAAEASDLARERRALTAQARLSAWVVAGVGAVALGLLGISGRLSGLLAAGSPGRVMVVVGLGLQLSGLLVVWWMMSRAGQ